MFADILQFAIIGGPAAILFTASRFNNYKTKKNQKEYANSFVVDGRHRNDWYELLENLTREEYEELSLGPLDGLDRSQEHAWSARRLVGDRNYDLLMRKWYPETVCEFCNFRNCDRQCSEIKAEVKRMAAEKRRAESEAKIPAHTVYGNDDRLIITKVHGGMDGRYYRLSSGKTTRAMYPRDVELFQAIKGLEVTGNIDGSTADSLKIALANDCLFKKKQYGIDYTFEYSPSGKDVMIVGSIGSQTVSTRVPTSTVSIRSLEVGMSRIQNLFLDSENKRMELTMEKVANVLRYSYDLKN